MRPRRIRVRIFGAQSGKRRVLRSFEETGGETKSNESASFCKFQCRNVENVIHSEGKKFDLLECRCGGLYLKTKQVWFRTQDADFRAQALFYSYQGIL